MDPRDEPEDDIFIFVPAHAVHTTVIPAKAGIQPSLSQSLFSRQAWTPDLRRGDG
jgi:hypothetical protein